MQSARAAGALEAAEGAAALRRGKARLHLLTALCDLGGVWDLDQVTGALTDYADAAVQAALTLAARGLADRLTPFDPDAAGPIPGLFVVALGKMGAFELNYSSDIDISIFYEPDALPLREGVEPAAFAVRLTQGMAELLQDRTGDGYVFRVDLRLRPDSTPPAVPAGQALEYYESIGQNWERAALIKARVCAGDIARGEAFRAELQPFIWRRHLDFAAIADIQSIKRQIQDLQPDTRLSAKGADLKLGIGGIREIEFFVQTQQLILGGRPRLALAPHAGGAGRAGGQRACRGGRRRGTDRRLPHPARPRTPRADAARRTDPPAAGRRQGTAAGGRARRLRRPAPVRRRRKTRVQGFIIPPPNFDPKKKYPTKLLIHGGPQGAWGDMWSYRWNAELFAANGYVVVMINPRGSTGYGQAFVDGVNGDWGGKPFTDLMTGLDYAEQHYPFIDKTRECALGASYGGFMANWILGHTDRFKCIVTHDGMFNPESAWGTTEELWFNEWEFKGKPWDYYGKADAENPYRKFSPALYAKNFKTPTLVIHNQLDYRLDLAEGFQLFTTLQRLKVPSKMLYFPDEGHWVLKPQNSQLWYKTVNDWVDQWTKQGTGNRE